MSQRSNQTRSPRSRAKSVHDELVRTADLILRAGEEFTEAVTDAANEAARYKARVSELEAMNRDFAAEIARFKATNEELRHLADAHKPEVDRAINARNAADRRVKNQLRVIRDLLEERKDGLANTPSYKPSLLLEDVRSPKDLGLQSTTSSPITEVRRGKQPERSLNPNRSNGASSSNTSTVRPRTREISQSTPGPSSHRSPGLLSLISSPQISVRSMRGNSGGALGAITQIRVTSPSSSGWQSDPSLDTTVHVPPEQDDAVWKLSASRPPVSAEVLSLPMSWVELQTRLDLDDDTMSSLESLTHMDDLCFRVQIVDDIAFVYDPFAMDGPTKSMLMDWGTKDVNAVTVKYIAERRPANSVLHTFTLPLKKNAWYYIGAHSWNIVEDFWSIWPTLGNKSRDVVIAKLRNRCNHMMSRDELAQMMEDGRLEQLCVEISSRSLKSESRAFAFKLGYRRGKP